MNFCHQPFEFNRNKGATGNLSIWPHHSRREFRSNGVRKSLQFVRDRKTRREVRLGSANTLPKPRSPGAWPHNHFRRNIAGTIGGTNPRDVPEQR